MVLADERIGSSALTNQNSRDNNFMALGVKCAHRCQWKKVAVSFQSVIAFDFSLGESIRLIQRAVVSLVRFWAEKSAGAAASNNFPSSADPITGDPVSVRQARCALAS